MRLFRGRIRLALAGAAALVLATVGLAACGGDDDGTQTVTLTASGSGKDVAIEVPDSADPGLAEITLDNGSDGPVDMQLLRVEGEHTPAEVVEAIVPVLDGGPFPDWLFAGGGGGTVAPSSTETVTESFEPGTYYVLNTQAAGRPDPSSMPAFEVIGEASEDELPEADATVQAVDYGFEATDLASGENQVRFENAGAQPHHILVSPLVEGTTVKAAREFLLSGEGRPVVEQKGSDSTAAIEGGDSQNATLTLEKPGQYVLYCFVSDRQGGPPHVAKGMVDKITVE
jgi:plastocyanin